MSTPTLYAVRDDGAELWDTGEPSPFPDEPGLGFIVDTDGRKFDVRPILSLTAQGSWALAGESKADDGIDPETKREYVRDRLGKFAEVPGHALADFMSDHAARGEHADLTKIKIGGSSRPDVFRVNHGMKREEMPQVPNEHKPRFLAEMKAQGVKVEKVKVSPSSLHPVQGEIDAALSGKMLPFKPELTEGNPIMISNDGYVLDGHHRWAAAVAEEHRTPGTEMTAYKVDLPIDDLLKRTAAWNEDAGIAARLFGGAKQWDVDPEIRAEAIALFKSMPEYAEFKKSFHAIQHHGGWLWAGRPGGGGSTGRHEAGHMPSVPDVTKPITDAPKPGATEARLHEQAARNEGKPDIIDITDPYGETVHLTKSMSMWHHLERKPDGSWGFTAERERLHRQIMQDTLQGVPRSENPTLFMLGGGPAAGKSTMVNSGNINVPTTGEDGTARNAVLINADAVKEALPEYKGMGKAGASFVHEESSWVAKQIQAAALAAKRDVVLDGTGDSKVQKLTAKIQQAREAGYRVEGHYATVPTELAVQRNEERYKRTGRHVDEEVIRATHADVSRTFPLAHDLFDRVSLYETKDGARLIAKGTRGKPLTVLDGPAYAEFLAKGNG